MPEDIVKLGAEGFQIEMKILLEDYVLKCRQFERIEEQIVKLRGQFPETEALLEIQGIGLVMVAEFLQR